MMAGAGGAGGGGGGILLVDVANNERDRDVIRDAENERRREAEAIINENRRRRRLERLDRLGRRDGGDRGDVVGGANDNDAAGLDADDRDDDTDDEDHGNDAVRRLVYRKKSGKKARRGDLEVRREMQRQRRAATAMGWEGDFGNIDDVALFG